VIDQPNAVVMPSRWRTGMRGFYLLWAGQFVSIFASRMTRFAITLWAWDLTGTATGLVLVGVASYVPGVVLSPLAGTLVDRWNRKLVLALSDAGAAFSALMLLILFSTGRTEIWHLYVLGAISGGFGAFQYPAYSAVVTTMVPREQYSRANGMRSVVGSASGIGAPLLAGVLLAVVEIRTILLIDLVTFFLALAILLVIVIPAPARSKEGKEASGSLWVEIVGGLRYVLERRSLVAIFLLFTLSNVATGLGFPLQDPMVLAKAANDSVVLGMVHSAGSVGFVAGGLLMSLWSGPRRRIHLINISFVLWGLLGTLVFGTGWAVSVWLIGAFFMAVFNPIINSAYIAILQAKVAPDLQGRIFGLENMVSTVSFPLGQLAAGLLADNVMEPALAPNGGLVPLLGPLTGTGVGAGMGAVIVFGGAVSILTGLAGYLVPSIRQIETLLPDQPGAAMQAVVGD
jgi:DHA3 family macrolide efflux protein-like MFS transporter